MASSLAMLGKQNAYAAVAASQTDSVLVAASAGQTIVVHSVVINQGDTTASTVTFNSKGSGAGTAIFPVLKAAANGVLVLPESGGGWFGTISGEGLTVTTGAGSTTSIVVTYGRFS
jgi:predicted Fe-Mo cluster-binding NifX family protein